jgi:cbb3-type cytochrome oxidase subunit 3
MKTIALLLVAITIAFVTYSQSNKEEVDLLQAAYSNY